MAEMRPAAPQSALIGQADPDGPTVELTYNATTTVYDYPAVAYDAAAYTPGAATMKPA